MMQWFSILGETMGGGMSVYVCMCIILLASSKGGQRCC